MQSQKQMEERILFEEFIFGDGKETTINDTEFCVNRIVMLPRIRPHKLDQAVNHSAEYCKNDDFRKMILEKSNECPVLIYRLFKKGVFQFEEIEPFLGARDTFLLCHYFWKEIDDFETFIRSKDKPYDFERSNDIDQAIEYGFLPSSIEFCLKYDSIDQLIVSNPLKQEAKWSSFEWSIMPLYLDLLSFSGFFGSIRCFKYLILNGFKINNKVLSMVICNGSFDLFHICNEMQYYNINCVCKASEFNQIPLLVFMIENGVDINSKDNIF